MLIAGMSMLTLSTCYFLLNTQENHAVVNDENTVKNSSQENHVNPFIANPALPLDQNIKQDKAVQTNTKVKALINDSATESFNSIYSAMYNKSISEEDIQKNLKLVADSLNNNFEKQEEMSALFQSLPADSLEKFFLQEMLMESNGGNQVLRQQIQHILEYNETESFMHLVEIAHFLGHEYLGEDTSVALNNKLIDTLSHTQSLHESPALFYHAIASMESDHMMSPIDKTEVLNLLEDIYATSTSNDTVAVKSMTARKIMILGEVEDQVRFAVSALDDDELEVVETVLLSLNRDDFYEDNELKSKVTFLSSDSNLPVSTRIMALNSLRNAFYLNESEINTVDRELLKLNQLL